MAQLPLERAQHVVVDCTVRTPAQERLTLRVDDGALDLSSAEPA
jgi:hypothetical protein